MRVARPWHWFLLNTPFGATSGFVGVTLGYIAAQAKMTDSVIAGLVAMNLLPHTWKVFWAPIADITLSRKTWYRIANALSCLTILAMAFIPFTEANLTTFKILIFANSVAISFLGMAVEGLMGELTPESERGRAAGWFQVGNLGGYGIGGGLALYVAEHISIRASFISLALILAACTLALNLVPNPVPHALVETSGRKASVVRRIAEAFRRILDAFLSVARDLYRTFASRSGVIALVLVFMPLGAGAAQNLFSAIAGRWHASADIVAVTTGVVGGLVAAAGCLVGGWISDRMSRRAAYALSGVILAVVGVLMALCPQNAYTYTIFTLAYNFATGMVYGTFTGFVLEVIGKGAIATKYNALASLSNIPIWYMTLVLGRVSEDHGPVNMLFADAGAGMLGLLVLGIAIAIVRPGKTRPTAPAVS